MHFFHPQTHNFSSDGDTSGYVATSEIPVAYYFIALFYKIFGYHDYVYRIVNTLIFLIGLFFLFKTFALLVKGFFWPTVLTLLLFTSPVLVFYGNNFLTDSSALALALIGWYFFIAYYQTGAQKSYYTSMVFFFLGGAYKITALMSLVALFGIFIIEVLGIAKFKNKERLYPKPLLQVIPFVLIFAIIGAWVAYAKHYNALHTTMYFSTGIFPLWDMDKAGIEQVLKNVREIWLNQYFHVASLYFLGVLFLMNLVFIRKSNRLLLTTTLLLLLGTMIYVILWFLTFKGHDYYTINLYILLVFNLVAFGWVVNEHYRSVFDSKYIKAAFFLFLIVNIGHAYRQMEVRYNGWWTEYPKYKDFHTITPYLRSIGIQPLEPVISLPDTSHLSLYLMNQHGWTECLENNRDRASIAASVKKGAKYLIVNGSETLGRDYIQSFLYHPIGQYGSVRIYKLDNNIMVPFSTSVERYEKISCGAEKRSDDGKYFKADASNALLEYGNLQSAERAYNGKYSVRLTPENAFAMTYRFKNVKPVEHYTITVFRWSEKGNGTLVAQASDPKEFYLCEPNKVEKLPNGWEKLTLDFYLNFEPKDGQFVVYLWNGGKAPVYFDDLTIVRETLTRIPSPSDGGK